MYMISTGLIKSKHIYLLVNRGGVLPSLRGADIISVLRRHIVTRMHPRKVELLGMRRNFRMFMFMIICVPCQLVTM